LYRDLLKHAQQVASQSGDPFQAAVTIRAYSDTEQTATQKTGPSGLRMQGAVIDKLTEDDTTVLQLRNDTIKIF
jgi:hypothetical protein